MVELLIFEDQFYVLNLEITEYGMLEYRQRVICCGSCVFDNYDCNSMHGIDSKQYCTIRIW